MNGHVRDELPALLAGELAPSAAAVVRAHLATCDRCRLDLAAVAFAAGELRSTARVPFAVEPPYPVSASDQGCGCAVQSRVDP